MADGGESSMNALYIGDGRLLVKPVWGGRMIIPADDLSITPQFALDGIIEPPLTRYFMRTLLPGQRVVDVGAHVGYFSVLAGYLVGETGKVIAIEADPALAVYLADNLSLNYMRAWCRVEAKAAYSENGDVSFYTAGRYPGNSSIHRHSEEYKQHYDGISFGSEIDAARLDTMLADDLPVDLLKLDIEGGEYHALLGLGDLLCRDKIHAVVMEVNRMMAQDDYRKFCSVLTVLGHRGATFHGLSDDGEPTPIDLDAVLAAGSCANLLMIPPESAA